MKSTLLIFSLLIALVSCQNDAAKPIDDGTLPGQFRQEIDPIRCALPTAQRVTIQSTSATKYLLTYDRFGQGSYQIADITATKSSPTMYELTLDGQSIGHYAFEELRTLNGTQQRWVLLVHHQVGTQYGLSFMGVKE